MSWAAVCVCVRRYITGREIENTTTTQMTFTKCTRPLKEKKKKKKIHQPR